MKIVLLLITHKFILFVVTSFLKNIFKKCFDPSHHNTQHVLCIENIVSIYSGGHLSLNIDLNVCNNMHDACIIFIETLQVFTDRHSLIHAILCMFLYAYLRYIVFVCEADL